jgi:hypothetical protein
VISRSLAVAAEAIRHLVGAATEASLIAAIVAVLVFAGALGTGHAPGSAPAARAANSGGCTPGAPGVAVDNTWSWSGVGSWALAGQEHAYLIHVTNYDIGCGSSSFVVSMTAPSGFSVSLPTKTIGLSSASSGYLWASVTSPSDTEDGNYALDVTVVRAGTTGPTGSFTSYYKVYSSDTTPPTLYWPNPADGQTITVKRKSSYGVIVSSSDDRQVRKITLSIDSTFKSTSVCDDISDTCQLYYKWSPARGQHTATFKAWDWMGNEAALTVTFTVG